MFILLRADYNNSASQQSISQPASDLAVGRHRGRAAEEEPVWNPKDPLLLHIPGARICRITWFEAGIFVSYVGPIIRSFTNISRGVMYRNVDVRRTELSYASFTRVFHFFGDSQTPGKSNAKFSSTANARWRNVTRSSAPV